MAACCASGRAACCADAAGRGGAPARGNVAAHSARGPAPDGRVKPEVVAPPLPSY